MGETKSRLKELIEIFQAGKSEDIKSLNVNDLLKLQFNSDETIIIKDRKQHKPRHLHATEFEKLDFPFTIQGTERASEEGWFYYRNPFTDPHVIAAVKDREYKKLSKDKVGKRRSFYIECDSEDSSGAKTPYVGDEGKAEQLKLLEESDLPYSYLIDTGGKSIHIGIILDSDDMTEEEYLAIQREIAARFPKPAIVDTAVFHANNIERLPGAFRMVNGKRIEQKLLDVNGRVTRSSLAQWIAAHPIITRPEALKSKSIEHDQFSIATSILGSESIDDFIKTNNIKVAGTDPSGKKIVHCYRSDIHKDGDQNPSAVIFPSGWYYCFGCGVKHKTFHGDEAMIHLPNEAKESKSANHSALSTFTFTVGDSKNLLSRHFRIRTSDVNKLSEAIEITSTFDIQHYFVQVTADLHDLYIVFKEEIEKNQLRRVMKEIGNMGLVGEVSFDFGSPITDSSANPLVYL